jgi:hypothetical protein
MFERPFYQLNVVHAVSPILVSRAKECEGILLKPYYGERERVGHHLIRSPFFANHGAPALKDAALIE